MSLIRKRTSGLIAVGVASIALAASVAVATPAMAADGDIVGEAFVTLDFTTPGSVLVDVYTKNLSTVDAYGTAIVSAPDGEVYRFGTEQYAPGATWNYTQLLEGYTCDDLTAVSAAAFGARTAGGTPEWTSGVVTYPDSRVTVIGCDTPPVDPPVTPEVPPTTTPGVTTPVTTTPAGNVLPASKTDGALLAATGSNATTGLYAAAVAAMALLLAGAGAVAIRRR